MTSVDNKGIDIDLIPDYPIRTPCQLRVLLKPFFGPKEKKDQWIYQRVPTSDIFTFSSEITENMVVYLAGFLTPLFGWKTLRIQEAFPDAIYKHVLSGTMVKVEFEKDARDFLVHRHPPDGCDMIFCWESSLDEKEKEEGLLNKNPDLRIVEFKKVFFHYDFELTLP